MLACARLGAIHSVVFGGFAAQELARRIEHAEVRRQIPNFNPNLVIDNNLKQVNYTVLHVNIV